MGKNDQLPPMNLLKAVPHWETQENIDDAAKTAERLSQIMEEIGYPVELEQPIIGPTVSLFKMKQSPTVAVSQIISLAEEVSLRIGRTCRFFLTEGPFCIGVEIPNKNRKAVMLRDLVEPSSFQQVKSPVAFALGETCQSGHPRVEDLWELENLLVTGDLRDEVVGMLNQVILSLLFKSGPDSLRLLLLDSEQRDFRCFEELPDSIAEVFSPQKADILLQKLTSVRQDRRLRIRRCTQGEKLPSESGAAEDEKLPPRYVVVISELADLKKGSEMETLLNDLLYFGADAWIYFVVATSQLNQQILDEKLMNNLPNRIAFHVNKVSESRLILRNPGAEALIGGGDGLFVSGAKAAVRFQAAHLSGDEIQRVVAYLKDAGEGASEQDELKFRYHLPPIELFEKGDRVDCLTEEEQKEQIEKITAAFREEGIKVKKVEVEPGPVVSKFKVKWEKTDKDRMEEVFDTVFGQSVRVTQRGSLSCTVELPNDIPHPVKLRDILESESYSQRQMGVPWGIGKTFFGRVIDGELEGLHHLLIQRGRSEDREQVLHAFILSLLARSAPEKLRLVLIDPMRSDSFKVYNGLSNLLFHQVITEIPDARSALEYVAREFRTRRDSCSKRSDGMVDSQGNKLAHVVVIFKDVAMHQLENILYEKADAELRDELYDILGYGNKLWIDLIFSTGDERLVGIFGSRIDESVYTRFLLSSFAEDTEILLGKGDMLYRVSRNDRRCQAAEVTFEEIKRVTEFLKKENPGFSMDGLAATDCLKATRVQLLEDWALIPKVLEYGFDCDGLSIAMIQRRFDIGYARSGKLLDKLEEMGYVSAHEGSAPRRILLEWSEFCELYPDYQYRRNYYLRKKKEESEAEREEKAESLRQLMELFDRQPEKPDENAEKKGKISFPSRKKGRKDCCLEHSFDYLDIEQEEVDGELCWINSSLSKRFKEIYECEAPDVQECQRKILPLYNARWKGDLLVVPLNDNPVDSLLNIIMCSNQLCNMFVFFDEPEGEKISVEELEAAIRQILDVKEEMAVADALREATKEKKDLVCGYLIEAMKESGIRQNYIGVCLNLLKDSDFYDQAMKIFNNLDEED